MSKSYRRFGVRPAEISNKYSRTAANRAMRKKNAQKLKEIANADEDFVGVLLRESSNVWDFTSDGLASFEKSGVNAIVLEMWSCVQSVLNLCRVNSGSLCCPKKWLYDSIPYIYAEEICEFLRKPFTVETLESLTEADVYKFAVKEFLS
jgi:hypothetical protein